MKLAHPLFVMLAITSLLGFRADETYTLKPKHEKDQVETYSTEFSVSADGADMHASMKNRYKVLKVEEDGAYEVEESTLEGTLKFNGEEQAMEKSEPKVRKYDKDGKEVKKEGEEEDDDPIADILDEVFDLEPPHAVKIGETWDRESEYGTVHITLEGKEKIGEVECLKITLKATLTKKDSSGEASGTFYIRASDFSPEKMEAVVENPKISNEDVLKKIEMKMTRVAD